MLAYLAVALGAPGSAAPSLPEDPSMRADFRRATTRYLLGEVHVGIGVGGGTTHYAPYGVANLGGSVRWSPHAGMGLHATVSPHLLAVAPTVVLSTSDESGAPELGVAHLDTRNVGGVGADED